MEKKSNKKTDYQMKNYHTKKNSYEKFSGNEKKYVLDCLKYRKKNRKNYVNLLEKKFTKIKKSKYSI